MTEKEAAEIFCLCRDFSALNREERKFALDVTKDLLSIQTPAESVQSNYAGISGKNTGGKIGFDPCL